jgi:hypothetical protein
VCHILLQTPQFFSILFQIDSDLAQVAHAQRCECGGVLHCGNYPRKPRGCTVAVQADQYDFRFSFCCAVCRLRTTPMSVRFLGRRVYLSVLVVLLSAGHARPTAAATELAQMLGVPVKTLMRWRQWWQELFPSTSLWQAQCARFMPPVPTNELPASLLERFAGPAETSLTQLLRFLAPLSIQH